MQKFEFYSFSSGTIPFAGVSVIYDPKYNHLIFMKGRKIDVYKTTGIEDCELNFRYRYPLMALGILLALCSIACGSIRGFGSAKALCLTALLMLLSICLLLKSFYGELVIKDSSGSYLYRVSCFSNDRAGIVYSKIKKEAGK